MAIIKKRYSDNGRTVLFSKFIETGKSDKQTNHQYISDETLKSVEEFSPVWKEKVLVLNHFLSDREKEVREKNLAVTMLEQVLRDMWEVLKRRVRRFEQPAEVLTYYELSLGGIIPRSIRQKDLLAISAKVLEGDAKAVEVGYPAMQNPDVSELQVALDKAIKEINGVAPADRAYDHAEEDVETLRVTADELISDVVDELRFNLRKKDPASQRRIIQSYGIEINYNKNEDTGSDNEPLENF